MSFAIINVMMIKHPFFSVLCFVLFLFSHIVRGQDHIDSLRLLLEENPVDTLKIDIYLSRSTKIENNTLALQHANDALMLSKKIGDRKRICKSYFLLTQIHDRNGNFAEARAALNEVKEQLRVFRNMEIEAKAHMCFGILDYLEGTYNNAVQNLLQAVRLYEELGDSITVASCFVNIGNCFIELENHENALQYYLRGLDIYEKKENEILVAMAYGNIGRVYKNKKDYDKAISYYIKSLQVNRKNNLQEDVCIDLNNIGSMFLDKQDFERASPYFKEAYTIAKSINEKQAMLNAIFNMGVVEMEIKNYQTAIDKFYEVLQLFKSLNNKEGVKDTYEMLSNIYERMGKLRLALKYRKEFEIWKDSLMNESHLNQVKEQEIKYETEKKDQQITLLAKEKELQEKEAHRQATFKKASFVGLALVTLLGLIVGYTYSQKLKNQKLIAAKDSEISEAHFKRQMSELEMKALRAQINPHFLFNCMNSINRMILEGENENASQYLAKFSKLVRLILENAESSKVSLQSELTLLESYIQLEGLRFKGRINYKITIDESVDPNATYLPSMVLQPFVENAIWHGLMHKNENDKGVVEISVHEKKGMLFCIIEDNGVGREKARELMEKSVLKTKSMGIKITEERLRLLSKQSWEKLVNIIDLKDSFNNALGIRVEINFPVS